MRWFLLILGLCWGLISPQEGLAEDILSAAEYRVLESGQMDSVALVVNRLRLMMRLKGKEAARPAVPALIRRVGALQGAADSTRQQMQELEHYMLDLLVKIDDVRAKSVLIEGMVASGSRVASGLLALGAVPEVIDSLGSHRAGMGWGAIMALMEMQKHRPERFGTKETDKIKGYLLRRVRADGGAKMAFIKGLGVFGDGSVISLLQQVAEQDTFSGPARKYVNRDCAERVLLEIRARKEN